MADCCGDAAQQQQPQQRCVRECADSMLPHNEAAGSGGDASSGSGGAPSEVSAGVSEDSHASSTHMRRALTLQGACAGVLPACGTAPLALNCGVITSVQMAAIIEEEVLAAALSPDPDMAAAAAGLVASRIVSVEPASSTWSASASAHEEQQHQQHSEPAAGNGSLTAARRVAVFCTFVLAGLVAPSSVRGLTARTMGRLVATCEQGIT